MQIKDPAFETKEDHDKYEEYAALKSAFGRKFWMYSITSDTQVEAEEKTVLSTYHPSILKFLRDNLKSYESGSPEEKRLVIKVSDFHQ